MSQQTLTSDQRFQNLVKFYHEVKHYPLKTAYRVARHALERESRLPQTQKQKLDTDKIFLDCVRYYVEKKHYTLDRANAIAKKVVERELAKQNEVFQK